MNPIRLPLSFISLLFCTISFAQSGDETEKGDKAFNNFNFEEALYFYNVAYDAAPTDADVTRRIANTYRRMGQIAMSAEWYSKTIQQDASIPEDMLYYAEALKNLGEYDEAVHWYDMYNQLRPGDSRALSHLKDRFYYKDLFADTARYKMKKLAINNSNPVIGMTLFEDEQVLISAVNLEKNKNIEESPFLDVYQCKLNDSHEFVQPKMLDKKVNSKYHDGPVFYSFAERKLYITRTNIKNGKPVRDKNGNVNLKLYAASFENGNWSSAQELKMNDDNFSTGHASISPDGQTMYFVSTKVDGFGGSDIYQCFKTTNGWSDPINLGPNINTAGNEMFPFIDQNGMLYFSSDGHAGLGGLDIFRSERKNEIWTSAINMGAPVNSVMDDFALVYDSENDDGYFCSNRGGKGDDDLYSYKHVNIERMTITGLIHAAQPEISLAGERIRIKNTNSGESSYQSLDEFERFEFTAGAGEKVEITFVNAEFFDPNKAVVEYAVPNVIQDPFVNIGERKVNLIKIPMHNGRLSAMHNQTLAEAKTIRQELSTSVQEYSESEMEAQRKSMSTLEGSINEYSHDFSDQSSLAFKEGNFTNEQYALKIKQADLHFESGNYAEAKSHYISASAIEPKASYPKDKINQIEKILELERQREIVQSTESHIANGDTYFEKKQFDQAMNAYQEAGKLQPDNKNIIAKINLTSKAIANLKEEALMTKSEIADKRNTEFEMAEPFIDLQAMEIGDVVFDFNKALIRKEDMPRLDQVVALMKQYPDTKLMIRAHCDSRGSLAYNQSLSMSRAMAVQGYLMQKGIRRERMTAQWFGEQRPLNGCIDNVPCEEDQHEINRRAEFKLIQNQ
jgi:outer membrane protein OmpA-like peptidoglycan-associated protein